MSAHESMEQAEHTKEAASENRRIALLIAIIALCLALSETMGKDAQTEAISKNVEASNLWAFFQAKSIRRTVVQTASEQSKLSLSLVGDDAAKAALQKQIDDWQKTAARYRSEPETGEGTEQLSHRAKEAEEERDLATAKYHHFELASVEDTSAGSSNGTAVAPPAAVAAVPEAAADDAGERGRPRRPRGQHRRLRRPRRAVVLRCGRRDHRRVRRRRHRHRQGRQDRQRRSAPRHRIQVRRCYPVTRALDPQRRRPE